MKGAVFVDNFFSNVINFDHLAEPENETRVISFFLSLGPTVILLLKASSSIQSVPKGKTYLGLRHFDHRTITREPLHMSAL